MNLTLAERVVAVVCLVYPFRLLLNALAGVDLHLGIVSFAIVGLVALREVRELPPGFPNPLDLAVAAFGALLVADLFLLTGPTAQAVKGLSVELRLVAFYFAARALRLRREFAVWLLAAMLVLATLAAVIGAVELHFAWGRLLETVGGGFDRRFWKAGMARLYSFSMSPLAAAYLLVLGLAGAIGLAAEDRRRGLVVLGVFCIWQALPLTLARAAITSAIIAVLAFVVVDRRRGWTVAAASLVGGAVAVTTFAMRGWIKHQANYVAATTRLADGSSKAHVSSLDMGLDLLVQAPFGYGLGQAGHVAMARGGLYPFDDTYYVTLGVQIGSVGLGVFGIVLVLAFVQWVMETVRSPRAQRGVGYAGLVMFGSIAWGGLFVATWNMLVPQLYFWLLTGVAANLAAKR
jgi:hypothetical protein